VNETNYAVRITPPHQMSV